MGIRENKIETYLDNEVKRIFNGETRKWVSPGHSGVPDRIIFIKDHPVIFAEVKTKEGIISPQQEREIKRLHDTGVTAAFVVLYNKNHVDELMKTVQDVQNFLKELE